MENLDQMSDLCCPICLLSYSEKDNVPHSLLCGHTHCNKCLTSLLTQPGSKCGECRKPINVKNVKLLPINYSVLRILETLKSNEKNNEFSEVETKIDALLVKLNENKNIYNMKLDDVKRKITEIEKENRTLLEAKKNLSKKFKTLKTTKTLGESLEKIKETIACIDALERQSTIISDRLDREADIGRFQTLFDCPDDYFITSEKTKNQTSYFIRNNTMYIKSFPQHFNKARKCELKLNTFRPFIVRTYLIISYRDHSTMIEFECFDKDSTRARHLVEMCLGEKKCYKAAKFYDHDRIGKEGESICFGHSDDEKSANNLERGSQRMNYIKRGYLTASNNPKRANHCKIYMEGWPCREATHCFGRVVKGLDILKSALKNKYDIRILESGVVLDFTVDI